MIRIIGGSARGTPLTAPRGRNTRPTLGRTRESIFNVLANVGLVDTKVLDIFAGTGALGLEAVSRGAAEAVLIDQATGRIMQENAKRCRMEDREEFDYIFMDPPYDRGYINEILGLVIRLGLPADHSIIIVEHVSAEPLELSPFGAALSVWKEKQVGETAVTYLLYTKI